MGRASLFLLAIPLSAEVSFNRDIRPILSDACYACHGPDKSSRMMGLRLDIRDEALKKTPSGAIPIVPGQPDQSAVIQRVFATAPARLMPPRSSHKVLGAKQKELLRQWVAEGAQYEGHWAYQPVRRPLPEGAGAAPDHDAAANPIDRFIQARLRREGLQHAPEAERRTLIRRVSLDLTGIPPTPAEVAAFLQDRSSDAYAKLVNRLLASSRYAEKQAMHWLDAVRYADTCGFHGDNPFPAWPYRDWVLNAFLRNKPFDDFTREQLAGDLLPNATREQRIASAYNRMNRTSAEGGIQPKEYLAKYAADRVRTTSAVWLGATMGCAECHDHKFDPFASKDFYSMKAFFADIKETGLVPDRGKEAWGSLLMLPTEDQSLRLAELAAEADAAERRLNEARTSLTVSRTGADREAWERDLLARHERGDLVWRFQRPLTAASDAGAKMTVHNEGDVEVSHYTGASQVTERQPGNGLVVVSGPSPDTDTYTVTFRPGDGTWTALGIQIVQDESLPAFRLARGSDRLIVTEVEAAISAGGAAERRLDFSLATDNLTAPSAELPAVALIDGEAKTGWGVLDPGNNLHPFLALRLREPLATDANTTIAVRIRHQSEFRRATTGRFRLALSSALYSWPKPGDSRGAFAFDEGGLPTQVVSGLRAKTGERTPAQEQAIENYSTWSSPQTTPLLAEVARLRAAHGRWEASIPRVVVTEAIEPEPTRVLARGNWMDESGEIVSPAIPAFLGKLDTGGRRATRLDLANWLASPENPLTARVFVNRQWRQFFGAGLSKVLDDLGSQGEWPVHPELLDWLAAEFMEPSWQAGDAHAWDMRHLIRTIVMSQTYRQSSLATREMEQKDPDNRLFARQSRYRVDAELVRDAALAISGLLVDKLGGPSVRPYQPDGYLSALNFPKRDYSASQGDGLYRRGVYTHWQRTFLHPSLMAFDAPSREECTVNRSASNTPLQSLVLLNDPAFVEAARAFAQKTLKEGGATLRAQLTWAFRQAVSRDPLPEERQVLAALHAKSLARYRAAPIEARRLLSAGEAPFTAQMPPARLAAMTTVARAILNLHETITRN